MREKNDCLIIGHNVHTVICQVETVILLPSRACTKRLLPCPAAGLSAVPAGLLAGSAAGLSADLLAWLPAPALSNPTAGNLNLDNRIPTIQIQAYRKRSAFGFGIPPYDLLIPREIQQTDGYNRVATV